MFLNNANANQMKNTVRLKLNRHGVYNVPIVALVDLH